MKELSKYDVVLPAVVDIYGQGCAPCRMMEPILESLSNQYPKINFYKLDYENGINVLGNMVMEQIKSVPTIFFLQENEVQKVITGATPKAKLETMIKEYFNV